MAQGLIRATPTGLMATSGAALVPWLLRGGFFIAVLGGSFLLLKNIILTIRRNRDLTKVGTNTPEGRAIGFASRCYAAIIPSGHPLLNDTVGDGTELDDLFQVAREIYSSRVGFALVSSKYKSLYDRDLLQDISNDLSRDEVGKWNGLLTNGLGGAPVALAPLLEHDLVTTRPTVAHTDALQPLQVVPAFVRLGPHAETLITAAGAYHGFIHHDEYGERTRFVPAADVQFQTARTS